MQTTARTQLVSNNQLSKRRRDNDQRKLNPTNHNRQTLRSVCVCDKPETKVNSHGTKLSRTKFVIAKRFCHKKKNNSTKTEKFPDLPTKRVECYTARAGALKPEITRGKSEPAPREKRESKEIKSVLSDFKSGKEDAESQPIKACTEEEASPPVSVINNNNNIKKWKERNLCACFVYRPGFWESRKSE